MNLTEVQLYNLTASASSADTEEWTRFEMKKMMAEHLYLEHNMKMRSIARRLGLKQSEVAAIIKNVEQ